MRFTYSMKFGAKHLVYSPSRLLRRCPLSRSVWSIWWQVSTASLMLLATENVEPKVLMHLGPHRPPISQVEYMCRGAGLCYLWNPHFSLHPLKQGFPRFGHLALHCSSLMVHSPLGPPKFSAPWDFGKKVSVPVQDKKKPQISRTQSTCCLGEKAKEELIHFYSIFFPEILLTLISLQGDKINLALL